MNATIVLPTRNRARLLTRAIESVLNQTHKDFCLIILDNCSEDSTQRIGQQYADQDNRETYVRHRVDIGASNNFLHGIKSVNTDFFCMLSDDDFLNMTFIQDTLSLLSRFPVAGFAILDTIFVDESLRTTSAIKSDHSIVYCCEPSRILFKSAPMTWTSMLFRSELVQTIVDAFDPLDKGADIRVLRSAAARYPYVYMAKPGAFFMVHQGSLSSAGFPVSERIAYFCQTLNRYAYISIQESVSQEIKDTAKSEMTGMLQKGIKSYMLSNCISTLRQFLANPTDLLRSQLRDYANELKGIGSKTPAAIILLITNNNWFVRMIARPLEAIATFKRTKSLERLQSNNLNSFASLMSYAIEIDARASIIYNHILSNSIASE